MTNTNPTTVQRYKYQYWDYDQMGGIDPAIDGDYVKYADYVALQAERDEALRRRDSWREKAEGFDAVRLALREKVGNPWPSSMSRILWAGIAADEKARADALQAKTKWQPIETAPKDGTYVCAWVGKNRCRMRATKA